MKIYTLDERCLPAIEQVKRYYLSQSQWQKDIAEGKMFGVMVVRDGEGLGFLAAYSGNLAGRNDHEYFVPPIYDMLQPGDFFRRGEAEITAINQRIAELTKGEEYTLAKRDLEQTRADADRRLSEFKRIVAERKAERDRRRAEGENSDILILESSHDTLNILYRNRVNTRKRLVKHYEFRVYRQASCNLGASSLATGKSVAKIMSDLFKIKLLN